MNTGLEDKILVQGIAEGNVRIFDYVFLHYYSGLVAYAIKLGVDSDVAEDMVQDFFLKLWINRKSIGVTETLKSYIFTSIRNRCYDYFRRMKVKEKVKEELKQNQADTSFINKDFIVESELRDRIDAAIEKLPEKCRNVFIMNRFEGLKPSEIAEKEGVSVRTVEGHIGKALKILRNELKPYLPAFLIATLLS